MVGGEINSILAADIGRQWTKVLLLERVEGVFRFVTRGQAPTTLVGPSEADGVLAGLRAAIRQVERITGRLLLGGGDLITPEDADGHGVDAFAATTSAAPDLSVVIAALGESSSLEAARQAARTTYCDVRLAVSANGGLSRGLPQRWTGFGASGLGALQGVLSTQAPDVVVLAGGSDGGSVAPAAGLAQAVVASGFTASNDGTIVFAGNTEARTAVAAALAGFANLRAVDNAAPARGVRNPEPLAQELDSLFREKKLSSLPGRAALAGWGGNDLEPGAAGFWLVLRFLARQYGLRVLGVDVGAGTTLMGLAASSGLTRSVWPRIGTGGASANLLDTVGTAAIARWAPFPSAEDHVRDYVARRQEQPLATPETGEQSWLELALVREALRAIAPAGTADLILGCGGALGHVRRPGEAALALLDGLQPCGVCQLTLDSSLAVSALGAVAINQPEAAAQVLLADALLPLGTAVCPSGSGRRGKTALTVRIRPLRSGGTDEGIDDGAGRDMELNAEVPFGRIAVIPAAPGKRVRLELRPARGFDVGLGSGAPAALDLVPQGLGIIVDCRGRPFAPPTEAEERLQVVQDWNRALGALG
jgi:hypothetical protein